MLHVKELFYREFNQSLWCVMECVPEIDSTSKVWARFTDERVARNFSEWLSQYDTAGLLRRRNENRGQPPVVDVPFWELFWQRRTHKTFVSIKGVKRNYWQVRYPEETL